MKHECFDFKQALANIKVTINQTDTKDTVIYSSIEGARMIPTLCKDVLRLYLLLLCLTLLPMPTLCL